MRAYLFPAAFVGEEEEEAEGEEEASVTLFLIRLGRATDWSVKSRLSEKIICAYLNEIDGDLNAYALFFVDVEIVFDKYLRERKLLVADNEHRSSVEFVRQELNVREDVHPDKCLCELTRVSERR